MKKYITPAWEILVFNASDIVTTSGGLTNNGVAGEVGSENGGDGGFFGDIF